MTDITQAIQNLRRPGLLIRAARHGLVDYDRKKGLRRVLPGAGTPAPGAALPALLDAEARHEEIRQAGEAGYSVSRHLEALIALMAEIRFAGQAGEGSSRVA